MVIHNRVPGRAPSSADPQNGVVSSIRRGPSNHPGAGRECLCAEVACEADPRSEGLFQCGKGMVAAVRDLDALLFLSCLRCSAAAILLPSWDCATANGCPPLRSVHSCLLPLDSLNTTMHRAANENAADLHSICKRSDHPKI